MRYLDACPVDTLCDPFGHLQFCGFKDIKGGVEVIILDLKLIYILVI